MIRKLTKADKFLASVSSIILFLPFSVCLIKEVLAACPPCDLLGNFRTGAREVRPGNPPAQDITGAECNITHLSQPQLCNMGAPNPPDYPWDSSAAWVGPAQQRTNGRIWAQTGWRRFNNNTSPNVHLKYFFEVASVDNGVTTGFRREHCETFSVSSNIRLRVALTDSATGTWSAYIGQTQIDQGTPWFTYPASWWINQKGNESQHMGEIWTIKTDMPGVVTNKEKIYNGRIQVNSQWQDVNLGPSETSEDPNPRTRWDAEVLSPPTGVQIWDKNIDDCPGD